MYCTNSIFQVAVSIRLFLYFAVQYVEREIALDVHAHNKRRDLIKKSGGKMCT